MSWHPEELRNSAIFSKGETLSLISQMGKTVLQELKGVTLRPSSTSARVSIIARSALGLHQPCTWNELPAAHHALPLRHWALRQRLQCPHSRSAKTTPCRAALRFPKYSKLGVCTFVNGPGSSLMQNSLSIEHHREINLPLLFHSLPLPRREKSWAFETLFVSH